MNEEETLNLKRLIVSHYSSQLKEEVNRVADEKGYKQQDFDEMLNED